MAHNVDCEYHAQLQIYTFRCLDGLGSGLFFSRKGEPYSTASARFSNALKTHKWWAECRSAAHRFPPDPKGAK